MKFLVYIKKTINKFFYNNSPDLILFKIGIFLLPTALVFSSIFLIISACLASFKRSVNFINDSWNFPLLIAAFLMIISSLTHIFTQQSNIDYSTWDSNLAILDLFNWLPFFFLFWAFSEFVGNTKRRQECAFFLISGSIPLLISGFLQLFTPINGPFKLFNGLLIWYQREIEINGGVSSIFNNANYYASWLLIIWPLTFASFLTIKSNNRKNKLIILVILISIAASIFLTKSRSAWGSLILSIPLILGTGSLVWLIPTLVIIFFMIFFAISPINENVQIFFQSIVPSQLWKEFDPNEFINPSRELRINIWLSGLKFIINSPYTGLGAGLFPILYLLKTGNWVGHTHNIFLELAFNYGILPSIILFAFLFYLIFQSYKKIINKKFSIKANKLNIFNKAWWASALLILLSQFVDIQYYDGRISIAFWILLSGLRSMLVE